MLVDDGNLRAGQLLTQGLKNPERPETLANILYLETGENRTRSISANALTASCTRK